MSDTDQVPVSPPPPPPPMNSGSEPVNPPSLGRRDGKKSEIPWLYICLGLAAGMLVGGGIGLLPYALQDVTKTPEYTNQEATLTQAEEALSDLESDHKDLENDLAAVESSLEDSKAEIRELESTVRDVEDRENELKDLEKELETREKDVKKTETEIDKNKVAGDGLYEVGEDIPAGKYKTSGKVGCYYAVLNSSDTFDISSNNLVDGVATVTVKEGDFLELSGCAEFSKQ